MIEWNVTFENMLLEVLSPILIAGEDKHDSIIKSSNQNTTVQNISPKSNHQLNQPPYDPSADIILQQPEGIEAPGQEDKVIAIYGLRQSGHEWYKDLMHTLTSVGFK